mmetsp:Transcript_42024/g.66664  ORF Transcript_42024/g.66664 Transcript_42024/m.66664 type:complete len:200 (-) Transcript_42024:56-655(-)
MRLNSSCPVNIWSTRQFLPMVNSLQYLILATLKDTSHISISKNVGKSAAACSRGSRLQRSVSISHPQSLRAVRPLCLKTPHAALGDITHLILTTTNRLSSIIVVAALLDLRLFAEHLFQLLLKQEFLLLGLGEAHFPKSKLTCGAIFVAHQASGTAMGLLIPWELSTLALLSLSRRAGRLGENVVKPAAGGNGEKKPKQ